MKHKKHGILCTLLLFLLLSAFPMTAAAASGSDVLLTRGQWSAARIVTPGEQNTAVLDQYDSNFSADQIWFAVNVPADNQAIQLDFTGLDNSVCVYLYERTVLESGTTNLNDAYSWYKYHGEHTVCMPVPSQGAYYLMLRPDGAYAASETPVKFTVSFADGDHNEGNDTWQTATELTQNVNTYYNLNNFTDVDWFKVTTTVPGEAVKFVFSNFDYTVPAVNARLYSGTELQNEEHPKVVAERTRLSSDGTLTYKVNEPGDYYLKLDCYDGLASVLKNLKLRYEILPGDANEVNDTYEQATTLANNVAVPFTINGGNDQDWFYFETTRPNELVNLYFKGFDSDYSDKITYYVYDQTETGIGDRLLSESPDIMYSKAMTFSNVGGHYICVKPHEWYNIENELTIRLERQETTDVEPNDTWHDATLLQYGVEQKFSLPSGTDQDWFSFTVDEPNQTLKLTFSNVPSDKHIVYRLYSGKKFETEGDRAGNVFGGDAYAGSSTNCYMMIEAGTYYLKTSPYNRSDIFNEEASVKYELISPDANEGASSNNIYKYSTPLLEGIDEAFTLPAYNDEDWFSFTVDEPNQTLKLTFSNVPSNKHIVYRLYSNKKFEEEGDRAGHVFLGNAYAGSSTSYYMMMEAGTYYLKISPYNGSDIFNEEAAVKYELISPDANEGALSNNEFSNSTSLTVGASTSFTLPANNDYDWFKLDNLQVGDQIKVLVTETRGNQHGNIWGELHVMKPGATELQREDSFNLAPSGTGSAIRTITNEGEHYLMLHGQDAMPDCTLSVRYQISRGTAPVTGITIMDHQATLPVSHTLTLNTTITPYYATNQAVTWSSSAEGVATVDGNGKVTAVAPGQATITVRTTDGGYTASCVIQVVDAIPVTGVMLDQVYPESDPKSLALDTSVQLHAAVQPDGATNRNVTWSSSNEQVLAVNRHGVVFAVGSGKAKITVTTADGSHTAETWFSVPDETYPVTAITLDHYNLTLYMGEAGQKLTASVKPTYATNQDVTWFSSNPQIAQVDQAGTVTAIGTGYATITVQANENSTIKAECSVSVQPKRIRIQGISFEKKSVDLGLYAELSLTPVFDPVDATVKNVTWSSSDKTVATVSRTGKVTAIGLGQADITATTLDGGHTATIRINVSPSAELGDLNNDGDIDAGDALFILRYSVGLMALSQEQILLADVSGDGYVDAADAILILRFSSGLIDGFPQK